MTTLKFSDTIGLSRSHERPRPSRGGSSNIGIHFCLAIPRLLTMARKCCIKNCRTNFVKNAIYTSLFTFPRSDGMRKVWEEALNITADDEMRVCSRHFPDHHMEVIRGQSYLKRHAKPELDLKPPRPPSKRKKFGVRRKPLPQSKQRKCVLMKCLIPYCACV